MTQPNRRNILTILGLAAASTPVVAAEALDTVNYDGHTPAPGLMLAGPEGQSKMATALDAMAAAVRNGELTALRLDVNSSVVVGEWMLHEIKFTCELTRPHGAVV